MGSVGNQIQKDVENIKDWLGEEGNGSGKPAEPIDISKIKDKSLQGIEERERNLAHEELFVFNENNELVEGYKGGKNSVAFPTDLLDYEGATVTHGHPKGMEEFGGTFSFADINNMLRSKWAEHRATAAGQGEMNYIMRRTANADAQGLRNEINRNFKSIEKSVTDTYRNAYEEEIRKGSTRKQAKHIARQRSVGELNAFYKRVMPQYGFEYINRKKEYQYNR